MIEKNGPGLPSFAKDPEAALQSYKELGYHIEADVWTQEECDRLVNASRNLPTFKDGTFAPATQAHRTEPVFLTAMSNPKIVSIMEKLVSGKVSGLQSTLYFGKPGTPGFTLHQDNWVIEAKPDAFASAWSALQDVTWDMGALVGYPRSHREPVLPRVPTAQPDHTSQDPNATREETVLPPGYEPVLMTMPRQAVLFMHSHFLHSSQTNNSDNFRRSLLLTYIRSGEKFREGNTAHRAEIDVYKPIPSL